MLAMFINCFDMLVLEFLVLQCVIFLKLLAAVKATLAERLSIYFRQLCMGGESCKL